MTGITLRDIRKSYPNGPQILHGVSLDIQAGEFVVIVGPSGCGKSTMLRLIAGLENTAEGDIIINGTRVNDKAPQDRDIAMIFQNYALYPHMTVRENIAFGLELRKMPKAARNAKAAEVAEILQLTPYLDRKPGALSGGQRQRVAMGRAMARDTSVFLMDEPLSNLDNALRVAMRTEIKQLHRQLGATIIYVTHDQTEALSLADRIAVMQGGHLQQFATPDEIYDTPANMFVAAFLGAPGINFVPAAKLPEAFVRGATAGLRPEMLSVHAAQPDGYAVAGRIVLSEMSGAEVILHIDTDLGKLIAVSPRQAIAHDAVDVWVSLDMQRALWFDADGRAIDRH
ncbi:multiple sugar transport system ATP-binding protein [Ketogulonicigenium robustum]|uniref:Multiple sugar transport system ATP-binding protein n=1 Tax=Ketogulonicigenium robustum TaxID=92947 RepID=A0A1W6NXH3_9RHOB|nr:ABC transporter ATP-binding protein [Ketogulonicigenium robustum]ARO13945.1 multiple sugar transport system ATP-binding protein [Ketogulonicigenium robustum]